MFIDFIIVVCTRIETDEHKHQLKKCIESIKTHININEKTQIVVVDSDSPDKSYIEEFQDNPNIIFENIGNKNYEAGAWVHVYKKYLSNRYLFIHDSCELIGSIDYLQNNLIGVYHTLDSWKYATDYEIKWVKDSFMKTTWGTVIEPFSMILGSIFYCQRIVLDNLYENGVFKNLPTNKSEAQAYERYIGAALTAAGYESHLLETPRLPIKKLYLHRQ